MKAMAGMVGLVIGLMVVLYAVGVVAVTWAWNTLAHGMLGAPQIEWYHALAALVLIGIVGGMLRPRVEVTETRR